MSQEAISGICFYLALGGGVNISFMLYHRQIGQIPETVSRSMLKYVATIPIWPLNLFLFPLSIL